MDICVSLLTLSLLTFLLDDSSFLLVLHPCSTWGRMIFFLRRIATWDRQYFILYVCTAASRLQACYTSQPMSSFQGNVRWSCRRTVESLASQVPEPEGGIETCSGRGGSTINSIGGKKVVIFGGANREMLHFSDVWVLDSPLEKGTDSKDAAKLVSQLYR